MNLKLAAFVTASTAFVLSIQPFSWAQSLDSLAGDVP
jgi:hypothetical protein